MKQSGSTGVGIVTILLLGLWLGYLSFLAESKSPIPEISAGQRWYVQVQNETEVLDLYIKDVTDETTLFIDSEDNTIRFKTEQIEFIELIPSGSYKATIN